MAEMVLSKYNETLTLGSYVELEPVEDGATMKFSKELVSNMDIAKHIETKINGEMTEISFVTKLELDYEGTIFRLNDKLEVSGVKINKEFTGGKKDEGALLVSISEINNAMKKTAEGKMKGILVYCEDPIVSADVIADTHSSIFDSLSTMKLGEGFVKVLSWYDNEWGYSCRLGDLATFIATKGL